MAEKQKKMKAASGRERDTKLLEAAKRSKRGEIINLLQKGANINALDESTGFSALHLAVEQGSEEVVNTLLMNGSDVKTVTLKGRGIMHIAVKTENAAMVQLLLSKVPNIAQVINYGDETGKTALHLALMKKNSECASLLYTFEGCNISLVDQDGCSALHYGASSGMTKDIDKLVKLGSDPNLQDKQGRTPLHHAALAGSSGAALALFRHGVDANVLDHDKLTAAALAEESGHSALAGVLNQRSQQAKAESGTSTENADSSSKSFPAPTHSRRPPPLPTTLPPEPEEVDLFATSDVGLAPPDVLVPPRFMPKSDEISDSVEGEEDDITADDTTDSIIDDDSQHEDKPHPPERGSLPPPPVLPRPNSDRGALPPPPGPLPAFIPPPLSSSGGPPSPQNSYSPRTPPAPGGLPVPLSQ